MVITEILTCNGELKSGLTPNITVYEITDTGVIPVITNQPMTDEGSGLYSFTDPSLDSGKRYRYVIDAGQNIHPIERIKTSEYTPTPEISTDNITDLLNTLIKFQTNRTLIDPNTNTLTIFDDDGVTPIKIFDLFDDQGNPSVSCIFERKPQ